LGIRLLAENRSDVVKREEKKEIRKSILAIRNKMKKDEVTRLSSEIIATLRKKPLYKESKNIMLYLSFGNEVDSFKLIEHCQEDEKKVIIPHCIKEGTVILPAEIKDVENELVKNSIGLLKPKPEYMRPVKEEDIDLIIIPGIAFDLRCYRIGFGAGYYR